MADPCKQEAPIAKLEERTRNQQQVLNEMAEALKENNELLRKVAEVLADIKHLSENGQRNEKAINELYKRVRELEMETALADDIEKLSTRIAALELTPGKAASRAWWVLYGALAGAVGSILAALLMLLIKGVMA